MARIPINRIYGNPTGRQLKRARKATRKQAVRAWQKYQDMLAAFKQLSPIDESRIRHRAEREAGESNLRNDANYPFVAHRLGTLDLAYKYTLELLGTIVI